MQIHNGDHAQYEIDNANTPPKERSDWPSPSFDARDWAEAFCKINPAADEGTMLAWFANALMRGFDEHAARANLDVRCERGCTLKKVNSALSAI
jgi:hypothetical protein